jgi:hypothetical protein
MRGCVYGTAREAWSLFFTDFPMAITGLPMPVRVDSAENCFPLSSECSIGRTTPPWPNKGRHIGLTSEIRDLSDFQYS